MLTATSPDLIQACVSVIEPHGVFGIGGSVSQLYEWDHNFCGRRGAAGMDAIEVNGAALNGTRTRRKFATDTDNPFIQARGIRPVDFFAPFDVERWEHAGMARARRAPSPTPNPDSTSPLDRANHHLVIIDASRWLLHQRRCISTIFPFDTSRPTSPSPPRPPSSPSAHSPSPAQPPSPPHLHPHPDHPATIHHFRHECDIRPYTVGAMYISATFEVCIPSQRDVEDVSMALRLTLLTDVGLAALCRGLALAGRGCTSLQVGRTSLVPIYEAFGD
ncbi:hypothetical protein BD410DRAFT_650664 [Rickenella mellea]|uniref:Uncharacterized protein n=1 Tax=Rickenella mellea TaxID=50990 RepID=A0A4Y7PLV0_9AGAM|nr:hypothetical protein BD410DRAFT_650664 [Rickenella mellea]